MPKPKLIPMYDPQAQKSAGSNYKASMALAQNLMGQDAYPVYSTGQGMLLAGSKVLGGLLAGQADRREKQEEDEAWNPLRRMVEASLADTDASPSSDTSSTGSSGPSQAYSSGSADGGGSRSLPTFAQGDLGRYAHAIGGIESSQRWDAIGPASKDGDRPYGKFQVMGKNIGPWTERHLGQRLTPEQFLADREAQQRVFEGEFGSYLKRYGNPQDAASMWFSGRPQATAGNRADSLGTTVPEYVQRFTQAAGGGPSAGGGPQAAYAQGRGPTTADGQPGVEDLLTGGGAQGAGVAVPKPDLRPARAQIQQALALMDNPRTRAAGWQLYQQALQTVQALQGEYRRQLLAAQQGEVKYRRERDLMTEREDRADARAEANRTVSQDRLQLDRERFGHEKGKPLATNQRVLVPDGQGGFREAAPPVQMPQNGVEIGPDGSIKVNPQVMKLTEGQSKDLLFHDRMVGSDKALTPVENELTSFSQTYGGQLPFVGNYLKTPTYRQAEQAGREYLSGVLRKDTGAAVTDREFKIYGDIFLPVPGDDPGTLTMKREARARAIEGIKKGLGTAQALAAARPDLFDGSSTLPKVADAKPGQPPQATPGAPPVGTVMDGHRFKGGDPADEKNWEKLR